MFKFGDQAVVSGSLDGVARETTKDIGCPKKSFAIGRDCCRTLRANDKITTFFRKGGN